MRLKVSFNRLYNEGNNFVKSEVFQQRLTSCQLKVKPKANNVAGLQLADLIAHPSRREILIEENKITPSRVDIFGDKITKILQIKYHRSWDGKIKGVGKKLLP